MVTVVNTVNTQATPLATRRSCDVDLSIESDRIETTDTMYEDGTVMLDNDDASCTTSQSRRVRSNSEL